MCRIIAAFKTTQNKSPINELIINQYQDQYQRGKEGFGIIRIDPKQNIEIDRACEPIKFLLDLTLKPSNNIIAHHRHPTSTHNKLNQTHPIAVSNKLLKYDYQIIHNGIVSNDEDLHEQHLKLKFKYNTEYTDYTYYHQEGTIKWNDSESLAIELARFIEKQSNTIGTDSAAAFIILQINKKTKKAKQFFFGKNKTSSVLNMHKLKQQLFLSSEGKGTEIKENILHSFKLNSPTIKLKKTKIPFKNITPITTTTKTTYKSYYDDYETITPPTKTPPQTTQSQQKEPKDKTDPQPSIPYDKTLRAYRNWIIEEPEDIIELEDIINEKNTPFIINKNYITKTCGDMTKEFKYCTAQSITHKIDDILDEQLSKIVNITNNFKEILLTDQLKKEDTKHFTKQIEILMQTMSITTHLAEQIYTQTYLKENLKESQNPENPKNT